jgi:ABC-type polar amino acid transport system ATPase subunit
LLKAKSLSSSALPGRANRNKIRAEVGMVFQQFNLFPHKSVLENITLAQRIVRRRNKQESLEKARQLLQKVGIPEKENEYPSRLSGGQQQRVAIARALAMDPKPAKWPTGCCLWIMGNWSRRARPSTSLQNRVKIAPSCF